MKLKIDKRKPAPQPIQRTRNREEEEEQGVSSERGRIDIEIYRGDTPKFTYQLVNIDDETGAETFIDITDATIRGQARFGEDSLTPWFEFPIEKVDPAVGIFKWVMTKSLSETVLPADSKLPDVGVYDIQIQRGESVFTFLHGTIRIIRDVTRG